MVYVYCELCGYNMVNLWYFCPRCGTPRTKEAYDEYMGIRPMVKDGGRAETVVVTDEKRINERLTALEEAVINLRFGSDTKRLKRRVSGLETFAARTNSKEWEWIEMDLVGRNTEDK